jgi:predicted alpha/beta hydrolase family esterase
LTDALRARGEHVLYPQLPAPSAPRLSDWLQVLHGELAQLGDGERIVVAHSCSVALWLLAAPELAADERVERVVLVAPPGLSAFIAPYRAFLPVGLDPKAIARASSMPPLVVTSDNDPYAPEGPPMYRSVYTDALGLAHEVISGAGHLSIDDGYGAWPAMLEWCLLGATQWRQAIRTH